MPLTGLSGTAHALGVRLTASSGPVRWRLGGLAVRDAVLAAAPTDLRVTGADGSNLRFAWQGAPAKYAITSCTGRSPTARAGFLGGTCQSAFYVGGLAAEQGESSGGFEVRAVGELFTVSTAATTTHTW